MRSGALGARGAALAALVVALLAGGGLVRADVIADIGPAVSVGWTDNANQVSTADVPKKSDEFMTLIGTARGYYLGRKTEQGLGYRLSYTKSLHKYSSDTISQEVNYNSIYNLTPTLDLNLGAAGAKTKTSAYLLSDQSAGQMPATGGLYMDYLTFTINQGLTYRPTARRRYIEQLSATRLTYLAVGEIDGVQRLKPPDSTYVNAHLRGEWERARDTVSLDGSFTDTYADNPRLQATVGAHRLLAQLLAGYHREFNPVWSGDAALGGVLVLTTDLAGIAAPAGFVNVGYRRLFWFASASVSQTAAPNIFLGNATINDQAIIRAALPLTRSELFVLSGNAGYTYARYAYQTHQARAYSLFSTGASLSWHAERIPIWVSLDYSYLNQQGSHSYESGDIPDRTRNVVMLTVGGSFVFGKGTPPILAGALQPIASGGAGSTARSAGESGGSEKK